MNDSKHGLQKHNERLELVLEGTRLGFWDWYPQTNEVCFSPRWAEMLGYDLSEIEQHLSSWQSRVHPDDLAACYADLQAHIEGRVPYYENVHRMRHKDGHWVHILDRGKIFERDADGRPTRFCGTHTDISAQKQAEQTTLEAQRSKGLFIANMSHVLRTPLTAVLGMSEVLLERAYGELTPAQERAISTILHNGQHLLELINDVIDISRLEAGTLPLTNSDVDIAELVEGCLAELEAAATSKKQTIVCHLDPSVPTVRGDARRLSQIVKKLVSNAVTFSPQGAVIEVGAQRAALASQVELWVADDGPGIPDADQARVLEPFVVLDSSPSREQTGAGLGLALVARLVRLHGGTISVQSAPQAGSRFVLRLPKGNASTPVAAR